MRRKFLAGMFAAVAGAWGQIQGLNNLPRCPVCHKSVGGTPTQIQVLGSDGAVDGSALPLPAMVCLNCGVMFCIEAVARG